MIAAKERGLTKMRRKRYACLFTVILIVISAIAVPSAIADGTAVYPVISLKMNGIETDSEFYHGTLKCTAENADEATALFAVCEKDGVITDLKRGKYESSKNSAELEFEIDDPDEISQIRTFLWDNTENMKPVQKSVSLYKGDGSTAGQRIYCYENFEDSEMDIHITNTADSNGEDLKESNLVVTMNGTDDYNLDVMLCDATRKIVLEVAVARVDDNSVPENVHLFNLTGINSTGEKEQHGYGKISSGKVRGYEISDEPINFAMAIDLETKTYDIYADGELCVESETLGCDYAALTKWKIWIPSATNGKILLDNIYAYDGDKPRNLPESTVSSEFSSLTDYKGLSMLYGKRALSPYNNKAFYNGAKHNIYEECIIENDEALVPLRVFEKLFNAEVSQNENSIIINDSAYMQVGSTELLYNDNSFTMEAAPCIKNGLLYLPVRSYGMNVLKSGCFLDDGHGLFLISDNAMDVTDERIKEASLYMFFERRSPEALRRMVTENLDGDITKHPRILGTKEEFSALRREIEENSIKQAWFERIKEKADAYLSEPVLEYQITNGRLLDVANEALERMSILGFTYLITEDVLYGNRLTEELEAVCGYPDWNPSHFLDTGTMAQAVALGFDWGYDCMSESQREYIAAKAFSYALECANDQYYGNKKYGFNWHKTDTNWGIAVNSGIFNLALAVAQYSNEAFEIASEALKGMEHTIYYIAPDGAWHEGASYWRYSSKYLALCLAGYESATGNIHEAVFYKGMKGYANFGTYLLGPDYQANNFADSSGGAINSYAQAYFAKAMNDEGMMRLRCDFLEAAGGGSLFDIIWCDTSAQTDKVLPLDAYYRETEFISMRERWNTDSSDSSALWLSAHGGKNSSSHSHVDAGSFVFNLNSKRWAIDLGSEDYSYASDNPALDTALGQFYYYRRKGEGHNIVVINPEADKLEMDVNAFAQFSQPTEGEYGSYTTVNLSDCYSTDATSYIRGFLLGDNRRSLTVRDEITLKNDNSELYWFMHTDAKITIKNSRLAYISKSGQYVKVELLTNADNVEFLEMPAERLDKSLSIAETENTGVSKLAVHITGASGDINIGVKISMLSEHLPELKDIPIEEW